MVAFAHAPTQGYRRVVNTPAGQKFIREHDDRQCTGSAARCLHSRSLLRFILHLGGEGRYKKKHENRLARTQATASGVGVANHARRVQYASHVLYGASPTSLSTAMQ